MAGFSDNEILVTTRRAGTSTDSFVSLSESHKIINNVVLLTEIPNRKDGVTCSGNSITWVRTDSSSPTANEFFVDWNTGKITHHSSREGLTNTYDFFGKGYTSIGTDRVWVNKDGGTVTETLTSRLSTQATKDTDLQTQITDNDQSRITDLNNHKDSTTAHSAANITFTGSGMGSTNAQAGIKEAWDRAGNIIASSGTSSSETVDMRTLESGYVANRTITLAGDVLRDMQSRLKAAVNSPVTVKRGLNSVNAPEGGKLDVKVKGVTRVNLLGKDGNCEDASKWSAASNNSLSLDSTNKVYGSNSIKSTTTSNGASIFRRDIRSFIQSAKYYLVVADARPSVAKQLNLNIEADATPFFNPVATDYSTTGFSTRHIKMDGSALSAATYVFLDIQTVSAWLAGEYFNVDGIRLYEIDSATYNKIDVDAEYTGDKLAEKFPYVDAMKPLTTPYIEKKGKNLLPPFTDYTMDAGVSASLPYKLEYTATGANQNAKVVVPVLGSTQYTINATQTNSKTKIYWIDANGTYTLVGDGVTLPYTFTTNASVKSIEVQFLSLATGNVVVNEPVLSLGSTATFEPQNNDYAYAISDSTGRPLALCSNIDGTVADEINLSTGTKFKRWEYADLDGSLAWTFGTDYTGFKRVTTPATGVTDSETLVKYDGKILSKYTIDQVDTARITGNVLYVYISDTDSGWTEAMTPDSGEMKAYFFGYKLCDAAGATYVSGTKYWKKITDGTGITSTLPTASYAGYTPYKLQYQLATAVEEAVSVEGLINLHSGLNQVESGEGAIVRERANPVYSGATLKSYVINSNQDFPASNLKNRTDKIIAIYKNGVRDTKWRILSGDSYPYGKQRADIPESSLDTTASYEVTYTLLDKYGYTSNIIDITASVPSTQKAVLETVVQQQADTATAVSVVQTQYARRNQGQWIAPVLLNAWVNYDTTIYPSAGYYLDEFGNVHLKGFIKNGTATNGTILFTLPEKYRPSKELHFVTISNDGVNYRETAININKNGEVKLYNGYATWLTLNKIYFRIDQ